MKRRQSGHSLAEMLTVIAIIGLLVLVTLPAFASIQRRFALHNAAAEMQSVFHQARSRAITRGANSGLRFMKLGSEWHFRVYDDGDRDGVRNDDITRGVDRPVGPPRIVLPANRTVTIGLLDEAIRDPDGERLLPGSSPVRFGNSSICSFSPLGQSSSGTIYVTDRNRDLFAIRVYGGSAKMRVLRYDRASRKWRP